MLVKKNDVQSNIKLNNALAANLTLNEIQDALIELANLISDQDDALVELANIITTED